MPIFRYYFLTISSDVLSSRQKNAQEKKLKLAYGSTKEDEL